VDTRILPYLPTPGHGAYPSAHATQAHAMATVLDALVVDCPGAFPDALKRRRLLRMTAHRIAVNRTVAGVHYPIDSWAGAMIGRQVGRLVLALARCGRPAVALSCDANVRSTADFYFADVEPLIFPSPDADLPGAPAIGPAQGFAWLWGKALAEIRRPPVGP
jgi:hypothetical protein